MKTLWQDARYGLRMLLKKPGFTLTAVITLAFEVSATDPLAFVTLAVLLSVVVFMACYLPARRATKVDPMSALRCE